jgi:hypothetical protein
MNAFVKIAQTLHLAKLAPLLTLLYGLLLAQMPVFGAVWPVTARWDQAAELRYSQWVEDHFHSEFFYRDTPYELIATDCADAAYGMRMVFAFENNLPYAIRQPGDAARLITQASSRFDHLPAGLIRFRAFMNWIMSITNTATLVRDTYPVSIERGQIRPGIIYLTSRTHAMQIVSLTQSGVIRYLESTAPREVRPMRSMLGFPHQVPADPRAGANSDGFRRFKTPQDYGKSERLLPGYGDEQFEQARRFGRETLPFYEWMQTRLAIEPEEPRQLARRSMFAICELTYDRASAVDEAQEVLLELRQQGRRCMNAAEFDEHSTPTRDRLLMRAFEHLQQLPERPDWPTVGGRYRGFVEALAGRLAADQLEQIRPELLSWCDVGKIDGGPGRPMDLVELQTLLREGRLVSDPNASIARRWGIAAVDSEQSGIRNQKRASQQCRAPG